MVTRIVFMGSPDFAVPVLRNLASHYPVVGVVTQPDRPAGRGGQLKPPAVKLLAQEMDLPLIQPQKVRHPEAMEQLRTWRPELIVVAAFGQILRQELLDLPVHGCLGVHASLLPRWRGAAPIQAAILNGDPMTGVTIMRMDAGMDTGLILSQRSTPILPEETAGLLSRRLAQIGADLLIELLPGYLRGETQPAIQQAELVTKAPLLKKEDGLLDFNLPAEFLARMVRAFSPWPGTYSLWQGQVFKVLRAHAVLAPAIPAGAEIIFGNLPAWGTASGLLVLDEVQPAGKRPMPGNVFLRGARSWGKHPEDSRKP
jgi:methionyl-tRNA formyltransferase